jgi:hypothetical protein
MLSEEEIKKEMALIMNDGNNCKIADSVRSLKVQ